MSRGRPWPSSPVPPPHRFTNDPSAVLVIPPHMRPVPCTRRLGSIITQLARVTARGAHDPWPCFLPALSRPLSNSSPTQQKCLRDSRRPTHGSAKSRSSPVKCVLPVNNGDQNHQRHLGATLPAFCKPARSRHPDRRVSSTAFALGFGGDHIGTFRIGTFRLRILSLNKAPHSPRSARMDGCHGKKYSRPVHGQIDRPRWLHGREVLFHREGGPRMADGRGAEEL
jgi:hypothetical protein